MKTLREMIFSGSCRGYFPGSRRPPGGGNLHGETSAAGTAAATNQTARRPSTPLRFAEDDVFASGDFVAEERRAAATMIVVSALLLTACATQIPPLVKSTSASYDGAELNSGVIALVPGGQLVTPRWRARYNGMIALYGDRFTPPLQVDDGIVPEISGSVSAHYFVDDEHAVKFDLMNEWRKAGVPAAQPVSAQ